MVLEPVGSASLQRLNTIFFIHTYTNNHMVISVSASLPDDFLVKLRHFSDVTVREGDIPVIELVDSCEGNAAFMEFLGDDRDSDPILFPAFGHPLHPYLSPQAQVEVFDMLATYQPLRTSELDVPFVTATFPIEGGFQYQTHRAIQSVQEQIQNPTRFAANCPCLCATTSGSIVCDLSIIYANAVIVLRIHKAVKLNESYHPIE